MVIGVVTEAKDKNILQRIFKVLTKRKFETEENPFKLVAVCVPYSSRELEKMDLRRVLRLFQKAVKKARKAGAERIVLSRSVMRLTREIQAELSDVSLNAGKLLFLGLAPECIRKTAVETGEKLIYQSVCISDFEMDRISEYLVRELCYDTKRMTIVTQNVERAESFCEMFFEESGLLVEVRKDLPKRTGIFINVDYGFIRFGNDLYIRDIDFGYKLFELDVKSVDLAACLRENITREFKGVYSYNRVQ